MKNLKMLFKDITVTIKSKITNFVLQMMGKVERMASLQKKKMPVSSIVEKKEFG